MNGWVTYNICEVHYCENAKHNVGYNNPFFSFYSSGKLSIVYILNPGNILRKYNCYNNNNNKSLLTKEITFL